MSIKLLVLGVNLGPWYLIAEKPAVQWVHWKKGAFVAFSAFFHRGIAVTKMFQQEVQQCWTYYSTSSDDCVY